ncbi:hypothetical protein [Lysinibacillus sp. Y5S-8]|uniref:hypothetical protein n=1 Tax=Lysinibacillus sp. Y5S-8 TaxID=3122488 RepID=UPI0030D259B4
MLDQFEGWIAKPLSANEVHAVANVYENSQLSIIETESINEADAILAGQFV